MFRYKFGLDTALRLAVGYIAFSLVANIIGSIALITLIVGGSCG